MRLSTGETQEVREDPAVQSVLRLFEGNLSHIDADKTIESSQTAADDAALTDPDDAVEEDDDD